MPETQSVSRRRHLREGDLLLRLLVSIFIVLLTITVADSASADSASNREHETLAVQDHVKSAAIDAVPGLGLDEASDMVIDELEGEANGKVNPLFIVLLSGIPVLLGPLLLWTLNRFGLAAKSRQMEYYLKRLELATKLREYKDKSETDTSTRREWGIVDAEVSQILAFIQTVQTESATEERREVRQLTEMSLFRRIFLLFKPITRRGWILHGLFYYMIAGIVGTPYLLWADRPTANGFPLFALLIFLFAIYGGLAAMFRFFALRSFRRRLEMRALESKAES